MKPVVLAVLIASSFITASTALAQPPTHLWSQRFGSTDIDKATSVTTDDSGNVIMTGYFWRTVNFGGNNLVSAGQRDVVVAKYSPTGTHLWSLRFGDPGVDEPNSVATDDSGNVFLAGKFEGTVDFGGGDLIATGFHDIFLAKYSPEGAHLWSQRFGGTGACVAESVAADDSGNVFVFGDFSEDLDLGGGNLQNVGARDIFLAKFSPDGSHLWSQRFGDTGIDLGYAVATDDSNNVLITGVFSGDVHFGGEELINHGFAIDIVVAKYRSTGTHIWSQSFGGDGYDSGNSITTDASGNVLITGYFSLTANFGGADLTAAGSQSDIVLARYSPTGAHLWSQRFGSTNVLDVGHSVAADASGNVFMTGQFLGQADFGGGNLQSAGLTDIVVAKYSPTGTHLWSERFGSAASPLCQQS